MKKSKYAVSITIEITDETDSVHWASTITLPLAINRISPFITAEMDRVSKTAVAMVELIEATEQARQKGDPEGPT